MPVAIHLVLRVPPVAGLERLQAAAANPRLNRGEAGAVRGAAGDAQAEAWIAVPERPWTVPSVWVVTFTATDAGCEVRGRWRLTGYGRAKVTVMALLGGMATVTGIAAVGRGDGWLALPMLVGGALMALGVRAFARAGPAAELTSAFVQRALAEAEQWTPRRARATV